MATITGVRSTVPTWKMTRVELARVWADHYGYGVRPGSNWIYSPTGRPVRGGWAAFAELLVSIGYVVPDRGIDWQLAWRLPHAATIRQHCSNTNRRRTPAGNVVRVSR